MSAYLILVSAFVTGIQGEGIGLTVFAHKPDAVVRNLNIRLICIPSGLRSQVRFARSPAATCSSRAADSVTGRVQDRVSGGGEGKTV